MERNSTMYMSDSTSYEYKYNISSNYVLLCEQFANSNKTSLKPRVTMWSDLEEGACKVPMPQNLKYVQ